MHSQTIDILVSEKSELLARLATTQTQLEANQSKHCPTLIVAGHVVFFGPGACASLSEQLSTASREGEVGEKERRRLMEALEERNKVCIPSFPPCNS